MTYQNSGKAMSGLKEMLEKGAWKVNRPPPPTYTEALLYPIEGSTTRTTSISPAELPPFIKTNTEYATPWPLSSLVDEPLYQTLPGEQVYLYQPSPVYSNIEHGDFCLKRFTYKITKTASGKPLIYLEAIPENLASSEEMGVKTYAQLEVVAAGSEREGELVYGRVGGSTGIPHKDVQTNGKAVLVPINGTITPDRMIVDALLNEHVLNNECSGGSSVVDGNSQAIAERTTNGPSSVSETQEESMLQQKQQQHHNQQQSHQHSPQSVHYSVMKHCDPNVRHQQVDSDLETLNQALDDDEKCPSLDEDTPLLHIENENAQSERKDDVIKDTQREKCKTKSLTKNEKSFVKNENKSDTRDVHVVVGECSCLNMADHPVTRFNDHVTDNSADHVIYSEPEYSSSDASISKSGGGGGGCASETPQRYTAKMADTCQKTLKRTHNGVDHTVFELSPSDSFYNSTDNVQVQGAEKDPSSGNSSDGSLCRLGHSPGSHTGPNPAASGHVQKGQHALNRDSSVSFKKPLVEGPSSARPGCLDETMPPDSPTAISADAEPLFTSANKSPSESNEAIAAQMILEDTRTYYRRKAADKGTLCCACVGVAVVATIVFLLIYFS